MLLPSQSICCGSYSIPSAILLLVLYFMVSSSLSIILYNCHNLTVYSPNQIIVQLIDNRLNLHVLLYTWLILFRPRNRLYRVSPYRVLVTSHDLTCQCTIDLFTRYSIE